MRATLSVAWLLSGCGGGGVTAIDSDDVVAVASDVVVAVDSDDAAVDSDDAAVDSDDAAVDSDVVVAVDSDDAAVDSAEGVSDTAEPPPGASFFAVDVLHRVDIVVAPGDLDALDNDLDRRVPCDVTYDGVEVRQAGCRKKGQSTLRPIAEKASLTIKLDELVPDQKIDGVERFAVHNTVMDPTFTSEPLTYLLYERAGLAAPRTTHAIVTLNGETKGFYVVVEAVNKRFLRQRFGDGGGNLYEGPWDFDRSVDDLELKDEDDGRTREDVRALQAAIMDADADAELAAALAPVLDVAQALRSFAVEMAYCLWDGYAIAAWNYYLYHVPSGVGGASADRFVFVPHGADWPYYEPEVDPFDPDFRPWGDEYPPGLLAVRLIAALPADYRRELAVVREAFDVEVMQARVDAIAELLRSAGRRDEVLAWELAQLDEHLDEPRAFVAERRAFLDGLDLR